MLAVAVHDDDPLRGRRPQPLDDRPAEPADGLLAVQHGHRERAVPGGGADHLGGVVGGVVHEQDLAGQPRGHRLGDPVQQLPDVRGLVEGRYDDGDGAGFGDLHGVEALCRDGVLAHRAPPAAWMRRISMRSGPAPKVATGAECRMAARTVGRSLASRRTVGEATT